MIRNLKSLGLAIGVVLVLSAVMASAAMAVPSFTFSSYPAQVTGSNTKGSEVFTTEGGKVECDSHFVSHSLSEASSSLTVTPKYTNCTAFGFVEATVNVTSCSFVKHLTSTVTDFSPHKHYYVSHKDLVCHLGGAVTITAGTCKAEIKGQTGLSSTRLTNLAGGTVTVEDEVKGIAYTVTQDGFLCPFSGTGNKTGGTYTGDIVMSRVGGGSFSVSGS